MFISNDMEQKLTQRQIFWKSMIRLVFGFIVVWGGEYLFYVGVLAISFGGGDLMFSVPFTAMFYPFVIVPVIVSLFMAFWIKSIDAISLFLKRTIVVMVFLSSAFVSWMLLRNSMYKFFESAGWSVPHLF